MPGSACPEPRSCDRTQPCAVPGTPLQSPVRLQGVTANAELSQPGLRSSVPSCHTGVVAVSREHLSVTQGYQSCCWTQFLWITAHLLLLTPQHQHPALPLHLPHGFQGREGPCKAQHGTDRRMRLKKPLPKHQHRHPAQPGCCSSPSQCSNWAVSPSASFCSSYRNCRAI